MPKKSRQQTPTRFQQIVWDTLKAEALSPAVDVWDLDTNQLSVNTSQLSAISVTAQVIWPKPASRRVWQEHLVRQTHKVKQGETSQAQTGLCIDSKNVEKEPSPADIVHVHSVTPSLPESYKVPVEINGASLLMELDTGAAVSLISKATWLQQLNSPELQASDLKLQSYPDRNLPVLGCCTVTARVQNADQVYLPLIVVEGQGPSLFGRNWLEKVNLDWREIAKVNSVTTAKKTMGEQLDGLIQQYKDVITDKLGHCRKVKAKLYMKENAIPKFHRSRPLPLALKAKVEKELDRQVKLGIIQKVDVSEWGTPIVPVVKPSGALRLCGDCKVTVNPQLLVNQYPLPRPEELFAALNGGQKFTTLDLSEAYLQIELEEGAKAYTTISTHKGLYSFNRLPYGIASAPAIFQCLIEQILPKLPGVVCYIDDILITGKDDDEHFSRLRLS